MILQAINNMFSKDQRDSGTKKALATVVLAPVAAEVLATPQTQQVIEAGFGQIAATLANPQWAWVVAIVAAVLGVARAAQPARPQQP